ncbi:MAG: HEAT repeat domain-containing protein, partial [Planctomycetota bacterium]
MVAEDRDRDSAPPRGAWLPAVAACALAMLPAIASAGEVAGEDARKALLVGLAKAGTKSLAEARAFLESEGKGAGGLAGEVRALCRRLKDAEFVEELAEVGLESTRGLIRVRTGDGAAAGRFIGIEDGVLNLRTSTGKTVAVKMAGLDAASVVRYSGVAASKTGDPAKAAVYYLMRGDPAAAKRALGDPEDGRALDLCAAIDELSGLLEPAPAAAAPGADAAAATAGPPGSGRPEAEEVSLPPPSLLALREFKKLGSPDEGIRRNAHNQFNNLRDWGMIPAITKALKGGNKERRLWLVYSLPQIRHPTVRACLRDLAANDRDVNVRSAAVRGLETQDAWPAIPDLLGYLARDKSPHVRAAAAHGLGRWRVPEAVKSLMRAMDDAGTVRAAAAHSLGRLNVTEAVPVLAKNLNHGESSVRSECARALGEIGGNAATAALLARLRRESPGASSGFTVCQIAASL